MTSAIHNGTSTSIAAAESIAPILPRLEAEVLGGRGGSAKCASGCTCLRHAYRKSPNYKHGWKYSKTYRVWSRMKERCSRPGHKSWGHYGGRGISVCQRWLDFENFLEDMGSVPEGMSIDRINVNGNYCPENCRWATPAEQSLNRTDSSHITAFGITKTASEWSRDARCVVSAATISFRKSKGWSAADILTKPARAWNARLCSAPMAKDKQ